METLASKTAKSSDDSPKHSSFKNPPSLKIAPNRRTSKNPFPTSFKPCSSRGFIPCSDLKKKEKIIHEKMKYSRGELLTENISKSNVEFSSINIDNKDPTKTAKLAKSNSKHKQETSKRRDSQSNRERSSVLISNSGLGLKEQATQDQTPLRFSQRIANKRKIVGKRDKSKEKTLKEPIHQKEILEKVKSNRKARELKNQQNFKNQRILNFNIKSQLKYRSKDELINLSGTNKNNSELRKRNISEIEDSHSEDSPICTKIEMNKSTQEKKNEFIEKSRLSLGARHENSPNEDVELLKLAAPSKKVFTQTDLTPLNPITHRFDTNLRQNVFPLQKQNNRAAHDQILSNQTQRAPMNFIPLSIGSNSVPEARQLFPTSLQNSIPILQNLINHNQNPVVYVPFQQPSMNCSNITFPSNNQGQPTRIFVNSFPQVNTVQNQFTGLVPGQILPQNNNNPMLILVNKPMIIPNQPLVYNVVNNFASRPPESIPLQIQYHTNLYCPNSNNNFFTTDSGH